MKLPVPTSVICGALGSGKTTLICSLLASKPTGEKWAVIVNEFGSLGIDGALLEGNAGAGIAIRELAGGCLCCQAAGMLVPAIAQLLRQAKPDRLLIEPSGLGHPAGLLQALKSEHLGPSIQLQGVICLVDARSACLDQGSMPQLTEDQINVADVLVGSKADLAGPEELQRFHAWAKELWPPKAKVLVSSPTEAPSRAELLDTPRAPVYTPLISSTHSSARRKQQQRTQQASATAPGQPGEPPQSDDGSQENEGMGEVQGPTPGHPVQYNTQSSPDHTSCGWLFHPGDVFKEKELKEVLGRVRLPHVSRFKGVFRVSPKRWVYVNWVPDVASTTPPPLELLPTAYTKDSRFEIIVSSRLAPDQETFTGDLGLQLANLIA